MTPNGLNTLNGSTSRNAVQAGLVQAEMLRALDEFNRDLPEFCRKLDISPAVLNLRTPELLMLICMRQQSMIERLQLDLNELSRLALPKE